MQLRKTKDLTLLEGNPRIIKDEPFKRLCKSIQENPDYFQARPLILSDRTGELIIIAGNQRYKAATHIGLDEVPTYLIPNLTEEREKEIIIRDNINDGEWDWDILANEWDEVDLSEWGLETFDMEGEMPNEADLTEEDDYDIPEERGETNIKVGDLIQIGPHRLVCGSSTEPEAWELLMQDDLAALIMTDPPYNVDYTGGSGLKIMNDKMPDNAFFNFLFDGFSQSFRYTKPGGAIYVWHADSEGLNFRAAFEKAGYLMKQCLVWVKNALVMGRQDYQWKHEPCLYGWKPGAAHYFVDERNHTTVIEDKVDFKKLKKDELLKILEEANADDVATSVLRADKPTRNDVHPTMKPILLLAPLIRNSSRKGEIIADGFIGSGSTMMACEQMDRICYGIELDPWYCQVIIDRMRNHNPELKIQINGEEES